MENPEKNALEHAKSHIIKKCKKNMVRRHSEVGDSDIDRQEDFFDKSEINDYSTMKSGTMNFDRVRPSTSGNPTKAHRQEKEVEREMSKGIN